MCEAEVYWGSALRLMAGFTAGLSGGGEVDFNIQTLCWLASRLGLLLMRKENRR